MLCVGAARESLCVVRRGVQAGEERLLISRGDVGDGSARVEIVDVLWESRDGNF